MLTANSFVIVSRVDSDDAATAQRTAFATLELGIEDERNESQKPRISFPARLRHWA